MSCFNAGDRNSGSYSYINDFSTLQNLSKIKNTSQEIAISNEGWVLSAPSEQGYVWLLRTRLLGDNRADVEKICHVTERALQCVEHGVSEFWNVDYAAVREGICNLEKHYGQDQAISSIFKKLKDEVAKLEKVVQARPQPIVKEETVAEGFDFVEVEQPDLEGIESMHRTLVLGDVQLVEIDPRLVEPGDVLCTYESVNTSPTVQNISMAQKLTVAGRKTNMSRMVHYEIVLGVDKITGLVKVAHANGDIKRVVSDTQSLDKFSPGTVCVIMRPNDPELKKEIVKIASDTVNKGNQWNIKGITDDKNIVKVAYRHMRKPDDEKLKQLARLAVGTKHRFENKKGDPKAMSCVQYATNVINSALIRRDEALCRILDDPNMGVKEKEEAIFLQLKMHGQEGTLHGLMRACGVFHEDVSSEC